MKNVKEDELTIDDSILIETENRYKEVEKRYKLKNPEKVLGLRKNGKS